MVQGDSGNDPTAAPEWLDLDRYNKVLPFMKNHAMTVGIFWHCSLVIGMCLNSLLEALVFTGASSTPSTALKRYMDTAARLIEWHVGNIWDTSTTAYKSIELVRQIHKGVRDSMAKTVTPPEGFCGFLTQYDLATVQTGFMGGLCMVPRKFGLHASDEELADYVYFWRCCGRQLGVSDAYNLCGQGKEIAVSIVEEITNQVVLPMTKNPPKDYLPMAKAYVDGVNQGSPIPIITVASTNACTYWALGVEGPKLSFADTLRFYCIYRVLFLMLGYFPGFEAIGSRLMLLGFKFMPGPPGARERTGTCPFTGITYEAGCPVGEATEKGVCPHAPAAGKRDESLCTRVARRLLFWYCAFGVLIFWAGTVALTYATVRFGSLLVLNGGGPWGH